MAQRQFRSDDTDKWVHGFGNRSDGDLVISANTTESPIDSSCTGTIDTFSLSATNASFESGQIIMIHDAYSTGVWELNKISSYTAGTITTAHPLTNSYDSGSQVRVLKQYSSVTINTGCIYTGKAWNGTVGGILGFFCNGNVTVNGTGYIDVSGNPGSGATQGSGKGFRGGAFKYQGEGTGGAGGISTAANGNGAGGSSNDNASASGGGNGAAGSAGTVGSVGAASGNASLTLMTFGGGGGGEGTGGSAAAGGGGGGGIIFIAAPTINFAGTGVTTVAGGKGGKASNGTGAAGSGAGGSILLKGRTITLGTNLLSAAGGVSMTDNTYKGGAGGVGRIHIDYAVSYTGTTTPTLDATLDATIVDAFVPKIWII